MFFIFHIFFGLATSSTSANDQTGQAPGPSHPKEDSESDLLADASNNDEENDTFNTYNIDYTDKNLWACHDCYKPKKSSLFQRKHILAICHYVGEYLLRGATLEFEQIKKELSNHTENKLAGEVLDALEGNPKQQAKEIIKNLRSQIKAKEAGYKD